MTMFYRIYRSKLVVLVLIAAIGLVACAPAAAPAPVPPAAAPTAAAPVSKAVTLQIAQNNTLGQFISDGDGRTVYLLTKDGKNTSNCYDKCEQSWPPVLPAGQPTLKDPISTALISTTVRKDGSVQLTYNGWPLYYYSKDSAPGDTNGQSIGKVWWVVSGEGNPIRPATLAVTQTDKLGKILVDDAGRTLYVLTKDSANTTTCYDKCEQAWPPLLMLDKPTVGDGIDASLLGSAQRKDGTMQVTLNGMPLYYFAADQAPGDTNGQGIGGVWFVVGPDGKIIG